MRTPTLSVVGSGAAAATEPVRQPTAAPHALHRRSAGRGFNRRDPLGVSVVGARARFEKGDELFRQDDASIRVYVVLEGRVKLTRANRQGREALVDLVDPGEYVGLLGALRLQPALHSAIAVDDCVVAIERAEDLRARLQSRPELALVVMADSTERLQRRLIQSSDRLVAGQTGRFAHTLLELADRFGKDGPGGTYVDHGLTQTELAQFGGITRRSVNRGLADFADRGWISFGNGNFVIHARQPIERWAHH